MTVNQNIAGQKYFPNLSLPYLLLRSLNVEYVKAMEVQVGIDGECIPQPIQLECGTQTCYIFVCVVSVCCLRCCPCCYRCGDDDDADRHDEGWLQ